MQFHEQAHGVIRDLLHVSGDDQVHVRYTESCYTLIKITFSDSFCHKLIIKVEINFGDTHNKGD